LATARRAMKPGAILLVNVPARDTWIATLLGRHWPLLLPEHLFYFSRASLRILLGRAGFDVLGYHRHVVFFSLDSVQTRLEQHGLPTAKFASRAFGHARLPLLMGEVTVVARAS